MWAVSRPQTRESTFRWRGLLSGEDVFRTQWCESSCSLRDVWGHGVGKLLPRRGFLVGLDRSCPSGRERRWWYYLMGHEGSAKRTVFGMSCLSTRCGDESFFGSRSVRGEEDCGCPQSHHASTGTTRQEVIGSSTVRESEPFVDPGGESCLDREWCK
jgi:hypothetical protein